MDPAIYRILERKRDGHALDDADLRAIAAGAADESWGDAELTAFLTAAFIHGLDDAETRSLTRAMLESGEEWDLAAEIPDLGDKHSTGGIGDKVSIVLAPLVAACGQPVVMLTGRGLGHTGGTADKLEAIPGFDQSLDRRRTLELIRRTGIALGIATTSIAPADRRLYALRDRTANVASVPLIVASILSKKLASGAAALVLDVKTGDGAFLPALEKSRELARGLVEITTLLGRKARALITDMSQPLGNWVGHAAEARESLDCLEGRGPADLMEVTYALCEALGEMTGHRLGRAALEAAIASGAARERFDRWVEAQGADPAWLRRPELPIAPVEAVATAQRSGVLARVHNRRIGELLAAAGGGRPIPGAEIDLGVSVRVSRKLGERIETGEELARFYLRREDARFAEQLRGCFEIADEGTAPPLLVERIGA